MSLDPSMQDLKHFEPALIFFDVDGTLLNTQGHYSPTLKEQLLRLQQHGVKLAIASGRPAIAAQFLFDELPLVDAGLFCTGAELYDPTAQLHLKVHSLDGERLMDLYGAIQSAAMYCELYTPDFFATDNTDHAITRIHSQHLRVQPRALRLDQIMADALPVTKLLLGVHERSQGRDLHSLVDDFPDFEFAFAHFLARPDWLFASVISRDANKIQGFQDLLAHHQVPAERVVAFGDSHSDRVFIEQAGLGVAMGTASDQLKAVANRVTNSSDADGVAVLLKQFFNE